ncbi:B3 DNA binding domain containing protein [Trema orientale]|uniref:B3 DNA binding domain containing protein n=1 Tax=Trema orientale TaxID=63057 RepID=A0A2P5DZE9_TREOI|nr:B3 DNA binding domain containing protein [Trema orientale]
MKLTKNDGNIWFEEGWPDFVKHFSIKRGTVLTFRYEANSEFHIVIFDTSTAEIDYPSSPVDFDKLGVDLVLRAPKEDVVEDDSIKILDDLSSCPKETEKSPLPYSQPCKRMGTKPTAHDGGAIQVKPEEILTSETLTSGTRTDETGRPSSLEIFPAKQASRCMSTPWKTSLNLELPPSSIQIARILRRVPFESEKPFFKVLMQTSYVGSRGTRVVSFSVYDLLLTANCQYSSLEE